MDNKNLPAYPINFIMSRGGEIFNSKSEGLEGLTKLELFAKDAPNEIPEWFQVEYNEPKPTEPMPLKKHDPFKRQAEDWLRDPAYDLPEELAWYQKEWETYHHLSYQYRQSKQAHRYFQWRLYFASEILRHLETESK